MDRGGEENIKVYNNIYYYRLYYRLYYISYGFDIVVIPSSSIYISISLVLYICIGEYMPVMSLDNPSLKDYIKNTLPPIPQYNQKLEGIPLSLSGVPLWIILPLLLFGLLSLYSLCLPPHSHREGETTKNVGFLVRKQRQQQQKKEKKEKLM